LNKMKRIIHSTLGKTLGLSAIALTLLGGTSTAYNYQESGKTEQPNRQYQGPCQFTMIGILGICRSPLNQLTRKQLTTNVAQSELIYTQIDIDEQGTDIFEINNNGTIAGSFGPVLQETGYIQIGGSDPIQLSFPGSTATEVAGINDEEFIFPSVGGFRYPGSIAIHGFYFENTSGPIYTEINYPGSTELALFDINNSRLIVGWYSNRPEPDFAAGPNAGSHGFITTPYGGFTPLDVSFTGTVGTISTGINDNGLIVGSFTTSDGNGAHGFLRDQQGGYTQLDVPCALSTQAFGINNLGEIVGVWSNFETPPVIHGFYRDRQGAYYLIDFPGVSVTVPFKINDNGQIVGIFLDSGGIHHGFKAQLPGAPPITCSGN
jgi:hypothetical protein